MAHNNNLDNLRDYKDLSPEEQRDFHKLGGIASGKKRREQKTFAEILKAIADLDCKDVDVVAKLKEIGYDGEISNKVAWVFPFIANIQKGDSKSFQMAIEMLKEDRKRELEIQRLQEEVTKLQLEQEQLKAINSAMQEQIQIVMDVDKDKDNEEEEQ